MIILPNAPSMAAARAGRNNGPALALQSLATDMPKALTPVQVSASSSYRLVLLKQNCIGEEKYSKAGRTCMAKVVVKKSPFLIQFAMEGLQPEQADINLHHFQFEARLVYEYDETKVLVPGCNLCRSSGLRKSIS